MVTATGDSIPQLLQAASALRDVRRSSRQFLLLWRVEQFERSCQAALGDNIPDLPDRDWRRLYRGSVLDD